MKKRTFILFITHALVGLLGFAAGIYLLPILTAPPAPSETSVMEVAQTASFKGEFRKDLKDSDALHWGEGEVTVGSDFITLMGKLAPGPDYRLYLSPEFVETEADFNRLKSSMVQVGYVKTFENFIVEVSPSINPADYTSVIIWCESFGQFITAAQYQ